MHEIPVAPGASECITSEKQAELNLSWGLINPRSDRSAVIFLDQAAQFLAATHRSLALGPRLLVQHVVVHAYSAMQAYNVIIPTTKRVEGDP